MSTSIESRAEEIIQTSVEYVPFELSEDELVDLNINVSEQGKSSCYSGYLNFQTSSFDFIDESLDLNQLYKVSFSLNCLLQSDINCHLRNALFRYGTSTNDGVLLAYFVNPSSGASDGQSQSYFSDLIVIDYGYNLVNKSIYFTSRSINWNSSSANFVSNLNVSDVSVSVLSGQESESYQNGYNVGYSVGQQAGEDIGYSNGFEEGYVQGESAGYESGFEAGQESVDTDSYYDAGYNAGYQVGYSKGYETGYDDGYSTALKSVQGSSSVQKSSIILDYLGNIECLGNPFYVSSYGLIDMEEYQNGANGYFYNTVPGTYNGITTVSYNIPFFKLNNNNYPTFEGDALRVKFQLMSLLVSLVPESGSATLDANLMASKIREVYVTYNGKKYYGNYSTSTSFANFDFVIDDFVSSGSRSLIDGDMTISFVLENSVTIVTNSNVTHYVSARYTPKVKFDLGRSNTGNSIVLTPYVTNDRVSANIQNQTNEITGALDEQKELQENQLEEQREQTETQKGIASSIKEFFGSFFDNLVNSIIGIFVPSQEEMSELFNRLNNFFAETFGFLYYPFDFIIDAFNIFLEADSETGLTLPGFSIMGYEVWGNQTYDITSEPVVGEIFGYVRMGTGALLAMWFVNYLRNFFDKRFGGGGN